MADARMNAIVCDYLHKKYPKEFPRGQRVSVDYSPINLFWEAHCPTTGRYAQVSEMDLVREGYYVDSRTRAADYTAQYRLHDNPDQSVSFQQYGEILDKLQRAEQELADLRRRFESLFRVPAVGMRTEIDQPPESPEQWRVRVHVPAFTVETTMGALTAAKGAPGMAMTWGGQSTLSPGLLQTALDNAKAHIVTHIVTGDHRIESIEPEPPKESA
jgi:hypothetical protein